MSAEKLQKTAHEQFQEITKQIEDLEAMIIENNKQIKKFHEANAALKQTIELLKEKRREVLGVGERVRPLTFADKAFVRREKG